MGGVMVDAGPLISAERAGFSPKRTLELLQVAASSEELSVSAIAYTELIHGIYRADSSARAQERLQYLHDIFSVLQVHSYSREMADVAGQLRAEQMNVGNVLPFQDSLIAATALYLQKPLLTKNVRDFQRMPGLIVIPYLTPGRTSLRI